MIGNRAGRNLVKIPLKMLDEQPALLPQIRQIPSGRSTPAAQNYRTLSFKDRMTRAGAPAGLGRYLASSVVQ